jgi:hypothetical protein
MRYMKYLAAFTVIIAMMGGALGATTSMSGGTGSGTIGGIGSTFGYTYAFQTATVAPFNYVQADILAIAQTTGIGTATVTTTVPSYVTQTQAIPNTVNAANPRVGTLTVGADGTVTASVQGKSAAAEVTSVGQIHSFVRADPAAGVGTTPVSADTVSGWAWISSAIGENWLFPGGIDQSGVIEGKPVGMFYADATANGEATYAADLKTGLVNQPAPALPDTEGTGSVSISGGVKGKTTIEGSVGSDHAEIKGMVGSLDLAPINQFLPATTAATTIAGLQAIVGISPLFEDPAATDDVPVVAAMASGAAASQTGLLGSGNVPDAVAAVANVVAVGAENDGIPTDTLSYASGTGVGSSNAHARVIAPAIPAPVPNPNNVQAVPTREFKVEATKTDAMSADAHVLKQLDAATAHSLLALGSVSNPNEQASLSVGMTYGAVDRTSSGSATDGSDRAFGTAFISSGQWNTWGAELDAGSLVKRTDVSGNLIQEAPLSGMGSGAFLQTRKLEPAYAAMLFVQGSGAGPAVVALTPAMKADGQIVLANIMGPKDHSLGSSSWDGSGVTADLTNLHVESFDKVDAVGAFNPTSISTDIAKNTAYFWCDGTNDNQFNGPGVTSTTPVFDPAGNGQFNPSIMVYLPSSTQRETVSAIATTQPSPIP